MTNAHALLFQKEDGTLYLGQKCKTPECADRSVPFAEWDFVIGRAELLPEPVHGMHYNTPNLRAEPVALQEFTEYFVKNYPGPDTIIMDPTWHAPKIFRAAKRAILAELANPSSTAEVDWISIYDRMPEIGQQCLVVSKREWESEPSVKIDRWDEQHECPVSWSSATVPIGPGWDDHGEPNDVTHWRPLPAVPATELRAALGSEGADAGTVCMMSGPNCDNDEGYTYIEVEILWRDDMFVCYRKPGCWPCINKWEHVLAKPIDPAFRPED